MTLKLGIYLSSKTIQEINFIVSTKSSQFNLCMTNKSKETVSSAGFINHYCIIRYRVQEKSRTRSAAPLGRVLEALLGLSPNQLQCCASRVLDCCFLSERCEKDSVGFQLRHPVFLGVNTPYHPHRCVCLFVCVWVFFWFFSSFSSCIKALAHIFPCGSLGRSPGGTLR